MRRSLFRQFSIAAVVTMLIVSGASVASAADSAPDPSFSVTATPTAGTYAIAGEDSWEIQVKVTGDGAPMDLSDPAGLTVNSASPQASVSAFARQGLGVYTAHVTTSVPDAYALNVEYNGLQIDSPIIQFFSSGPDPLQSSLFAIPEQILAPCGAAVVQDPVIATATVRDSQGTGIPGLEVVFKYGTDTPMTRTTDNDGVASAELFFTAPNVSTTKIVTASVNVDGESIDLPSASVVIEPEEGCSSEEVRLNWRVESPSQVVGLPVRILITALDVDGQITIIDRTKLSVIPSSSDVSVSSPASNRRLDGSYFFLLNSSTPGDYTVSVTYDGKTDGLSLPFSFVEPAPLPDVLPDPDQSYIVVSKWLAAPGDQVSVTAVMRDSDGQGVDNAQVFFSTESETYQPTCMTLADGRCSVTISSAVPAVFGILARFNGQPFGSQQTVEFTEEESKYLMSTEVAAVSPGPMRADGYDSWEVWVTILDSDSTPVTGANAFGLSFTVIDATNDAMVLSLDHSAFEAQPGGVYHTYLTSLVPGTYLVYASYSSTWADPVAVSFSAVSPTEPGARLLLTRTSELDNAVQVNENDREVYAKAIVHDEQGQPMSAVKVDFTVGNDTDVLSARQCYTDETGQCSIRVWPNELGEHSVYASIASEPLIGSPATVRLVSASSPVDQLANLSEFTVSPAVGESVPADGVSQWVGTVTLAASPMFAGFPMTGRTEDVEEMLTPSNPAVTVGDIIDNDDDTYTVTFTSDQPGDYMVTAYYQGVAIERDIAFSKAAPPTQSPTSSSPAQSSTSASPSAPLTSPPPSSPTSPPPSGPTSPPPISVSPSSSLSSPPPTQLSTSASPSSSLTSAPASSTTSPTQPPPSVSASSSPSSPTQPAVSSSSILLTPTQPATSVSSSPSTPTQPPTSPTQPPTSVLPTLPPTSVLPTQPPTSSSPSSSQSPTNSGSQSPTEQPTSPTEPPTSPIGPTQSPTNPPTSPIQSPTGPTQGPSGPSSPIGPAPSSAPAIDLSAVTVVQGQTLRIDGENWVPGETVTITLYSTPISLGTRTANLDGTINPVDVVIDLEPGQHTVQMDGSVSGTVEAPFTVLAAAPSASVSSATPAIPSGGTAAQSPARWVLICFLAIGAGLYFSRKITLGQGR